MYKISLEFIVLLIEQPQTGIHRFGVMERYPCFFRFHSELLHFPSRDDRVCVSHGFYYIGNHENAGFNADFIPLQISGITGAIHPYMVLVDNLGQGPG